MDEDLDKLKCIQGSEENIAKKKKPKTVDGVAGDSLSVLLEF